MPLYKEIVTKAVIGKGKKYFKNNYSIEGDIVPTTILGCWVINHKFKGYMTGDKIGVDGSFDVNIWYSYENDSKTSVINKNITYNDVFNLKTKATSDTDNTDIIVRSLKQPTVSKVNMDGKVINVGVEKELGSEIVGDTKVKIMVEDNEEPWDIIDDDVDKQIDDEVKDNYI